MKKIIKIFIICLLVLGLTSCKKEEKKPEEKNKQQEVIKVSARKQNIIDLAKQQMINQNIIIEEYLKTFDVTKVSIYGYYKKDSKKDIEIDFTYSCNTDINCVKGLSASPDKSNVVWIQMNEEETKIEGLSTGISINKSDIDNGDYIRTGEIIK